MFHQANRNDFIFMGSLLYFCIDLQMEWDGFSGCSKPIHKWLSVSLACAFTFRLLRLLVSWSGSGTTEMLPTSGGSALDRPIGGRLGELLLEGKGSLPRAVAAITWGAVVPFFAMWNFMGSFWLYKVAQETPQCMPANTYLWFSGAWCVLCHYWLLVHLALGLKAWLLRRQVFRSEENLREMAGDEGVQSRWGNIGQGGGARSLVDSANPSSGGLSMVDIKALPCEKFMSHDRLLAADGQCECSICINALEPGDMVRRLPGCGHCFHRPCIDLWLVRRAECPLCKRSVATTNV